MNSKAFLKLLERYQKNKTSGMQRKIMDAWYDSIDQSDVHRHVRSDEEAGKIIWKTISKKINEDATDDREHHTVFWKRNFFYRLTAACLIGLAVYAGYRYSVDTPMIAGVKNEVIEKMNRFANETQQPKSFSLPDGSKVILEPEAELFYPATFATHNRQVYLKGDVFFDIAHDKTKPFYVHANNIVTKVLGTSFTIKENKKTKSIEVAVMTGIVEVTEQQSSELVRKKEQKVVLTQNKKVTYYPTEEKLITGLVEKPKMIQSKLPALALNKFNYVERPLTEIVSVLENAYGVKITVSNEKLRNCTITADLSQENTLFTQLEILCESIEASYQLTGDTVKLSGNGCDISK